MKEVFRAGHELRALCGLKFRGVEHVEADAAATSLALRVD